VLVLGACGAAPATPTAPLAPATAAATQSAPTAPVASLQPPGTLVTHSGSGTWQSSPFVVSTPNVTVQFSYTSTFDEANNRNSSPIFDVFLGVGTGKPTQDDRIIEETGIYSSEQLVRTDLTPGPYTVSVSSNATTWSVTLVPGGTPSP
jgi:hypothetical protein